MKLTPEQRRFLGSARSVHDAPPLPEERPTKTGNRPGEMLSPELPTSPEQSVLRRAPGWELSRIAEMQNLVLIFGAVLLLGAIFYVGKKYEAWKSQLAARKQVEMAAPLSNKFAGATAEELMEEAIADEHTGNWQQAAERLVAAKYKNVALPGAMFRAGKLYYDHNDFDAADRLFAASISFGENIDEANYFRGMIASGRDDWTGAEHYFEAAANAAPFSANYYYSLAETCRKDHRPKEAIPRYEQAARRSSGDAEQTIYRFKERMASLEAGEVAPVNSELEKKRNSGPLSVDWLLTAAAIAIHQFQINDAVKLVDEAREADRSRMFDLFTGCVSDRLFTLACQNNPELAQACRAKSPNTSSAQPQESVKPEPP